MTVNAKVFIGNSDAQRARILRAAFDYVGLYGEVGSSTKIFVKPNFTYPKPIPGVTTSRELLSDALRLLSNGSTSPRAQGTGSKAYSNFEADEGTLRNRRCPLRSRCSRPDGRRGPCVGEVHCFERLGSTRHRMRHDDGLQS